MNPRDYPLICPSCARDVARRDRTCPSCGQDLRKKRPLIVEPDDNAGPPEAVPLWRRPLVVGLAGALVFAVLPFIFHGDPAAMRTIRALVVVWCVVGVGTIMVLKASEGVDEVLWYIGRPLGIWHDDPTDPWLLAFLGPAIIGIILGSLL